MAKTTSSRRSSGWQAWPLATGLSTSSSTPRWRIAGAVRNIECIPISGLLGKQKDGSLDYVGLIYDNIWIYKVWIVGLIIWLIYEYDKVYGLLGNKNYNWASEAKLTSTNQHGDVRGKDPWHDGLHQGYCLCPRWIRTFLAEFEEHWWLVTLNNYRTQQLLWDSQHMRVRLKIG